MEKPTKTDESFVWEPIELHETSDTNAEWKEIMSRRLLGAAQFEIHCWHEETKEIRMALRFGTIKDFPWDYGTVISGPVTQEFQEYLLSLPKPTNCEVYNKMTPFFSIFLDDEFSSEHYGTELNQKKRVRSE